ncbi:helix-turn-helix domain-containing protein [Pedobacter sandarakinus]|uniref:helix-turn-helix domain-containing protein n=1 Tax=Pedobacter sandarakinus TaxID=353156 RepID=UPI00224752E4|nr:helix-turn-helix domain-containing protein [Pedobacter sandarakinus]MCX2575948.1 helix-turn-helix domain-containing protein [Pedobacter sandarakinus]
MENIIVTSEPQLKQLIVEALITVLENTKLSDSSTKTKYLSTEEASKIIKKSAGALRQIVHKGEIPSIKRGNALLFLEEDLILWIEKGRRSISTEDPAKYLK